MSLSSRHLRRFERKLRKLRVMLGHHAMQHDRSAHEISQSREDQADDLASSTALESFALTILDRDRETLAQIDDALDRIEEREYGKCLLCDCSISLSRLDAIPHARHCIDCANWLADHSAASWDRAG